jgi:hypothetical protein
MHVLLDQLSAALVGSIVLLMLFSLHIRVQSSTIEDTLLYTAKKQTLSFAEILERDLANTGYLTVPGQQSIEAYSNKIFGGTQYTDTFQFWGSDAGGNRVRVRYDATVVDTVEADGTPVLRIERSEDAGAGFQIAGASMSSLTDFDISLLDVNNNGATMASARKIRVRFENAVGDPDAVSGVAGHKKPFMQKLRWGITLSPRGLRLQQFQG